MWWETSSMPGVAPWEMLNLPLPYGARRAGWCGRSWCGDRKDTHEVDAVLLFVDRELPKEELVQVIRRATSEWEPHGVEVIVFADGETNCPPLWSRRDQKDFPWFSLAEAWGLPPEMVAGL